MRGVGWATDLLALFVRSLNNEVLIVYDGSEIILGIGGKGTRQTMTFFKKYPQTEMGA